MARPSSLNRRLSRPAPSAQSFRPLNGKWLIPLVVLTAVVATACGGGGSTELTAEAGGVAAESRVQLQGPPATVDDSATWLDIDGFSGAQWATSLTGVVEVVEPSITVTARDGQWVATGLVRNGSTVPVAAVTVVATLSDPDGSTLAVVSADVSVDPLRPGEPAPFSMDSDVVADEVALISWSVTSEPADGAGSRALSLATFWQRGYSDPRPVDHYLYRDEPPARPFVLVGSVTNLGSVPVADTAVTVAWVDAGGRVLAVAEGAVVLPDASVDLDTSPPLLDAEALAAISESESTTTVVPPIDRELADALAPTLAPTGAADFLVVVPEGAAPAAIDTAAVYLWAMGS